ncbi:hypothetical protein ABHF33_10700 [Chitinibacter sp. FCG-7]|uniref:Serine/threonine protein phosphatase n=1 Tax=Chitinibacter mangrovi TaxID=3153927 RepID=A0AAU7F6M8_9NEIS
MLSAPHLQLIEQALARSPARVLAVALGDETVIIKRQESRARPLAYRALNLAARMLGQPLLCAVPAYGGAAGQATEVRRLQALQAAGVAVPSVLHIAPDWIALSHAGEHSIDHLLSRSQEPQLAIWESALAAILDAHRKGQVLSQAFARNIHRHQGQIVFIDFEDDPTEVLSQEQAQARDWLLYLHSTAYLLQADRQILAQRLLPFLHQDSAAVQALIFSSARSLGWLRHLPRQRKPWGRDVISLQSAAAVMHALGSIN